MTDSRSMFIFVRHGQSVANLEGRIAVPETVLTEMGLKQAHLTGKELLSSNVKAVISSPYTRAKQTAEGIADELGIAKADIIVVDEVRERDYGDYKGQPKELKMTGEWYVEVDNEANIEPRRDLLNRMHMAMHAIKKIADRYDGPVVVVGHAIAGFYLMQAAEGVTSPDEMKLSALLDNAESIEVTL